MSRILCVDDEPAILRLLGAVLARDGHEVVTAATGAQALAVRASHPIDAVLLDLGLPDRDGLELIQPLRQGGSAGGEVPVLVLTARSDVGEKVAALDLGASDYVTKPFDGDELLARLRAALRQSGHGQAPGGVLSCGAIAMDVARHETRLDGEAVALTRKEFALLRALLEAGGRVLTHADLLERVWGRAHRDDVEYLRVAVRGLRRKLEADPAVPQRIRNEPGIGYRLVP